MMILIICIVISYSSSSSSSCSNTRSSNSIVDSSLICIYVCVWVTQCSKLYYIVYIVEKWSEMFHRTLQGCWSSFQTEQPNLQQATIVNLSFLWNAIDTVRGEGGCGNGVIYLCCHRNISLWLESCTRQAAQIDPFIKSQSMWHQYWPWPFLSWIHLWFITRHGNSTITKKH